jgi:hypothetical protein
MLEIYGNLNIQSRNYIPRSEPSHLPICNDLIQAFLLFHVQPVAFGFLIVPTVDHVEVLDSQQSSG